MRTFDELRGISASFRRAAKRSSIARLSLSAIAFSFARLLACFFARRSRFLLRSIELVFAISSSPLGSGHEGHLEALQQRLRLGVSLCGRADHDVHATDLLDLVVVDLREHQLLLEAERVVAPAVEALAADAAEVADARQRDGDQAVEELVHPLATQGHLAADVHSLAQLEGGDRLARLGD